MSAALATLRRAWRAAETDLAAARTSHTFLLEACNRKLEESAAAVSRLASTVDEYDTAIETLEGAQ